MTFSGVRLGAYQDHCSQKTSTISRFSRSQSRSEKKRRGGANCSSRMVWQPSGARVESQMLSGAAIATIFSG